MYFYARIFENHGVGESMQYNFFANIIFLAILNSYACLEHTHVGFTPQDIYITLIDGCMPLFNTVHMAYRF